MELLLISFLSIDNFCSIKLKLLWPSELPWILDNKLSPTKTKTINFSTPIQNYCLTSFSWAVVTFVVPNLSQSDYLNLPVTVDKLLATKRKARVNFAYLANKYRITYLPQLPSRSSSFLSINATAFWLPTALDNQQPGTPYPPIKRRSFEIKSGKGSSMP